MGFTKSIVQVITLAVLHLLLIAIMSSSTLAQYQLRQPTGRQTEASITITDPSGSATWEKGKRYTIKWQSTGLRGSVKIVLEAGGKSTVVAASTINSGTYNWTVGAAVAEGAYKLVVMSVDGKTRGESAGSITIQKRSLGTPLQPGTTTPQVTPQPSIPEVTATTPSVEVQEPAQSDPTILQPVGTQIQPMAQPGTGGLIGLTQPDLELVSLRNKCQSRGIYNTRMGWLHIEVGNNGRDFTGSLLVSGSNEFQPMFAQIFEDLSIPQGQSTVLEMPTFNWPALEDSLCSVDFEVYLDQNNEIAELNEDNNSYAGPVYYKYDPQLRSPEGLAYIVTPGGHEIELDMIDLYDRPVICRGALLDFDAENNLALIDVKLDVQNCGGANGTFTIVFKAKYEGYNTDVEVDRLEGIPVGQGEVRTVRKQVWVDRGVWYADKGAEIDLRIYAIEAHVGYEDLFFRNRFAFCERDFD